MAFRPLGAKTIKDGEAETPQWQITQLKMRVWIVLI